MVSFLNSGILVALIAVTIPLLIHLINRHKQIRIKFSTIQFLKSIEAKRIKKIKLYQILLILVRTLLLIFLVLAFARPTIMNSAFLNQASAHSTVVIILDNGINMQVYDKSGNRFNRAKEKLMQIRAQYTDTDQILVLPAQDPERILSDSAAISTLLCSYTVADWRYSVEIAYRYFISHPNINKDLYILSDFQFHDPSFPETLKQLENIRLHLVHILHGMTTNISIDTVMIRNKIFETGQPVHLDVSLHNSSNVRCDDRDIHLFLQEQRIAYQKVSLEPLESKIIPLSFQLKNDQKLQGYVELGDDDLLADNRYYFAVQVPDQINVLFVEDQISQYFDAALNSIDLNTNLNITREKYTSWARQRFDDFQILFLSNLETLSPVLIQRLGTYSEQGGCIIFMPGDKTDISEFNRLCRNLNFNIQLNSIRQVAQSEEYFTLYPENWNQPVFSDIFRNTAVDLSNPHFYKYFQIHSDADYERILSFNTHEPFILRTINGNRSMFLITSSIDDLWTDLHYKGIFLPLMVRIFFLGSANPNRLNQSISISQEMLVHLKPPKNYRDFFIQSSDGIKNKIITRTRGAEIIFDLHTITTPGNYKLFADADELLTVAVNANPRSLIPPFIELKHVSSLSDHIDLIPENDDLSKIIDEQRSGTELGKFLVLLAVTILFLEIILVKKIEGQKIN